MTPIIKSITISNFRSIMGPITVPLDAPVVLIHGQNGSGKTSILSAIELGLTGSMASLSGLDSGYASHLIHKDATEAKVVISASKAGGVPVSTTFAIKRQGIIGSAWLSPDEASFYSERCYLAQATVGRLLEIYQDKDTRKSDSPLTKFVKDLLGLDDLDALIEGLHDAGNVRRLRTAVPIYWNAREGLPALEKTQFARRQELASFVQQVSSLDLRIGQALDTLQAKRTPSMAPADLLSMLENQPEEEELQRISALRRDIFSAMQEWKTVQFSVDPAARQAAEGRLLVANANLEKWRQSGGLELEMVFTSLDAFFSELPDPSTFGPEKASSNAVQLINAEIDRCQLILARDEEATKSIVSLDEIHARAKARAEALEEQISTHAAQAGSLAQALAGIMPHIHSEDCPVCHRDFNEVSPQPLQAFVSDRIAALTESSGRLQALIRDRAEAIQMISTLERDRSSFAGRKLADDVLNDFKTRRAALQEALQSLDRLRPSSAEGGRAMTEAGDASRQLGILRSKDQSATTLRELATRFAEQLKAEPMGQAENLANALDRFLAMAHEREEILMSRLTGRRQAIADLRERQSWENKRRLLQSTIDNEELRIERLKAGKATADQKIEDAKELLRRASKARTDIVRRVFNDSLNSLWRDLFVRLAPDEPFVPSFALPETNTGPVEAILETHYRSGAKGGNPRAMLSAGNLNTAALTLFLALHLSAAPTLPCLVIDDPVQSMDEVHIAQFAALLRTLSKQNGRQVIIAVHEKPLFDYLSLELSPAFQDDRLITIELGRSPNGETFAKYTPLIWHPDQAITAA